MKKIFSLGFLISLIAVSCTDPNTIGLEVQPTSDNIIISSANFEGITSSTESVDSIRTDEASSLILGQINDPVFGLNQGAFYTQILLTENNIILGSNPKVDSVVLSYTYSGYYGSQELVEFDDVEVNIINEDIYKDSIYFSNSREIILGSAYWVDDFSLSNDSENPFLRVKLRNEFVQEIFNESILTDNETFLQEFKGISVLAHATNTMLYLNPDGSNSFMRIYYNNDDGNSLSLDFELGGDAARINLFNSKELSDLQETDKVYIQSMAGYKAKVSLGNLSILKESLNGKVINKSTISFNVSDNFKSKYEPHEKLVLVRVDNEGNNVFLYDFIVEGDTYFGGKLEDGKYTFNITRYLYQLLNDNSYTNELYLLPAGAAVNANRTILDKEIQLQIYYSEL
tara:strand:+ start:1137 stop:2333 length:1197 start_codon:yes stop_codon:yes gene_type:complete